MKFKDLCKRFDAIEATRSRLEIADILSDMFRSLNSEESAIVCYLLKGRVAPDFVPVEFNISDKTLLKVLDSISLDFSDGSSKERVGAESKFDEFGDMGKVAESLISSKSISGEEFSITEMYTQLWDLASVSGQGSVGSRISFIGSLLRDLSSVESKYVTRLLISKLRLGVADKSIIEGLSVLLGSGDEVKSELIRAFGVCSDIGYVASISKDEGVSGLTRIEVVPGVPIASMLAAREKDLKDVYDRLPNSIVQPKFDGLRCQIHVGVNEQFVSKGRVWGPYFEKLDSGDQSSLFESSNDLGSVKLYSRNLEDLTDMFPEVVSAVKNLDVDSVILDSEVVGWDSNSDSFIGFQSTMKRRRKYGVESVKGDIPVKAFVFDVLYLNGESVMDKSNKERIDIVDSILVGRSKGIGSSEFKLVETIDDLEQYFEINVEEGLEGIMIKDPESSYKPGSRGYDWIKFKRAYQGHLADTVDLVVLGYNLGRGRQVEFGIGSILCGIYDSTSGDYLTLAKVGTGVTDDQWKEIMSDLDSLKVDFRPSFYEVDKSLIPDVWVDPCVVVTVEADEITKSPNHSSGYALRFPRLKIWGRDKSPESSTSLDEIIDLYSKQI